MSQLLEIQPSRELKFLFEVKKQSTCNVQLINKTNQHVAFKVKTTSPKKYCVRPNVGVVAPMETFEFLVIMQAQRSLPSDTICKDKFLVQSTIVPDGTMEDDVTSEMFSRQDGKHVEERKLKVVIVSPPHSPELSPMNGKMKQVSPVYSSVVADEMFSGSERHSPHELDEEEDAELKIGIKEVQRPKADVRLEPTKEVEAELINPTEPVIKMDVESQPIEDLESNLVYNFDTEPVITKDLESRPIEVVESNTEDKLEEIPVIRSDVESQPNEVVESNQVERLEEKPVIVRDLDSQPIEVVEPISVGKLESKSTIMRNVDSQKIEVVELNSVDRLESKPVIRRDVKSQPIEVVDSNPVEKLEAKSVKGIEPRMVIEKGGLNPVEKIEAKSVKGIEPRIVIETDGLRLAKDVEEMKSKLLQLESKLSKAEKTILNLTEESRLSFRERQLLEKQLALLKTPIQRTIHEEIPLLSVCMVAMLSILIGYLLHR